jgi:drug/metabolite transporter (DMT)-like permease
MTDVPTTVIAAVLVAALLHASWNTVVKSGPDKLLDVVLVGTGMAVAAAGVLSVTGAPAAASWPYVAVSAVMHVAYFMLVAGAYESGDLGAAYPTMRGTAPMLVALASAGVFHEPLSVRAWLGVLLICGGVLGLAVTQRSPLRGGAAPLAIALGNAVVIAAYTCVDGLGVRLSGNAPAYTASVLLLDFPALAAWAMWRRSRRRVLEHVRARWAWGLAGGAATVVSYTISLWAMTQAPVAAVAALRETGILFGVVLATLVLRERFGAVRGAAAASIFLGAVALRLG